MCDLWSGLKSFTVYVISTMLLIGMSMAQDTRGAADVSIESNAFAPIHQALNEAADKTLEETLAQRSWMQQPTKAIVTASRSSRTETDSVARLRSAINRVDQLRPTIEPILRDESVPAELSAVVLVESGGMASALSPKGARGLWQFTPDTARRYGLVVSAERDDRLDVMMSTRAAARYLRDLHRQFGDWQLAFAAYNAGEKAIDRALIRTGQRSFLSISSVLPLETREYVPAVLQAMSIFGGNLGENPSKSVQVQTRSDTLAETRVLYASPANGN
ncbi:MAG TPA: lytic transglycosylase domain-containing protein [Terriglobales bacterium]|nr:lytic transglycosylase domain-containing protein [Terriglobales bacterium]